MFCLLETIRFKHGYPIRLDFHLRRLIASAHSLNMCLPPLHKIETAVRVAAECDPHGAISLHVQPDRFVIHSKMLDPNVLQYRQEGIRAVSVLLGQPLSGLKTTERVLYQHARAVANGAFAQEALLKTAEGLIIDGSYTNVFAVIGGMLVTPPAPMAIAGTMRSFIIDLARAYRKPLEVRALHENELLEASELFVTNALVECLPVHDYNGKVYAVGPVARWVQSLLSS